MVNNNTGISTPPLSPQATQNQGYIAKAENVISKDAKAVGKAVGNAARGTEKAAEGIVDKVEDFIWGKDDPRAKAYASSQLYNAMMALTGWDFRCINWVFSIT